MAVGLAVVAAIERDRSEIDVADLPVRIVARLSGIAPGLVARLTQSEDAVAYAEQLAEGPGQDR
ncbi:hypothetical protein [Rhodococcus sp. NPDC058521]|uniref:hypothetical protein n=1 Tax=Rhodococcus sp. NPDC058521 TaxID=3346536 RepID=UPI003657D9DE